MEGGRYIRPIVLFQAQPKTNDDNTTFEKLKQNLLEAGIPKEQIKIKTANIDELKGIDLMSKECEVRYIITINALKEGWDCPFAYILASLADKSSSVDVEQILGRVLRQPYVQRHKSFQLNLSYVLTASAKFNETLQSIVKGLQASGFSEKDYRQIAVITDQEKSGAVVDPVQSFLFPEQTAEKEENEIDTSRISFVSAENETQVTVPTVIQEIETMAEEQNKELERQIEESSKAQSVDPIILEMGEKVKRYQMKDSCIEVAEKIQLPQFLLEVPSSDIFNTGEELLNRESLLKDFKLSDEDTKIDFDKISSDLYKVDLEESSKGEYRPSFTKIEDQVVKDPITEYILSRPRENPITDTEIKKYVMRILDSMNSEQLHDILVRKWTYTDKIKLKIRMLADSYAEKRFDDLVKSRKIKVESTWKLPAVIIPGSLGSSIGNSLYEREGAMNGFEEKVIMEIGTSSNIAFWHRNLERGKGFYINGYKANHYPDFILVTKKGKIILIETKGDHLDNADSAQKCRLGAKWEQLAGSNYAYFMIFDQKEVEGAYKLDKEK